MDIVLYQHLKKCNAKRNKIFNIHFSNLSFFFFVGRYYFSDVNKKKSYRSLNNIDEKIKVYSKNYQF